MANGYPNYHKDPYQIFYSEYNEFEDKTLGEKNIREWTIGENNVSTIEWQLCLDDGREFNIGDKDH